MIDSLYLYPQPRGVYRTEGQTSFKSRVNISMETTEAEESAVSDVRAEERICSALERYTQDSGGPVDDTQVTVRRRPDLHPQGYRLELSGNRVEITYSGAAGLHYAVITFEQLLRRYGGSLPNCAIEDEPDLEVRGIMLDIGRNKIPKMETLYALIDKMTELKLNHLQLYMEGYCFEYEKYSELFPEETPITAKEFQELDAYAKKRFVDLVPNQNCFGHMAPWLAKEGFQELAELPEGFAITPAWHMPASTLNPLDPRSIELVTDLFDELLPNFTSSFVNVNMDEPFELGMGKSKERAAEIGVGSLYMEFASKVFDAVRKHGKKTLMWGDIVTRHPEVIPSLPKDVIVLDWNYEGASSFENHCRLLRDNGISFYVCPGTSSWTTLSGRTANMKKNILDAAENGLKYGAGGLIVTDWGDMGHWQSLPVSYPGYVYAAGVSWQVEANREHEMETYLNDAIFQDRSGVIGAFLMELGDYYHLERSTLMNMTYTNYVLTRGLLSVEELEQGLKDLIQVFSMMGGVQLEYAIDYQYEALIEWLERMSLRLKEVRMSVEDANTVAAELENTIRLIEQGVGLHRYMYRIGLQDVTAEKAFLQEIIDKLRKTIAEYERLWHMRNRAGGLLSSMQSFRTLLKQYEDELGRLESVT
ncbi:family 20 glycosylhydrolase [Paenibacillus hodogayensis]|uniref:beta-N-acetylhexosaminidase n=1 Tax=Paenibacillus hodogayensis TaxID=279208 RepID=A0ABV5W3W8_9BACL